MILALETSADVCSLAVRDAKGTLVERAFRHRMHLSERLLGDVAAVLDDADVSLTQITGLAVDIGPGSFTGIRVGVMTIKTWSDTLGIPVCGVSALEILAYPFRGLRSALVVPCIRARPGAVYTQRFQTDGDRLYALDAPQMRTFEEFTAWREANEHGNTTLAWHLCGAAPDGSASPTDEPPRASALAALAAVRFAEGASDDPLTLVPLYLAAPPIDPRMEAKNAVRVL